MCTGDIEKIILVAYNAFLMPVSVRAAVSLASLKFYFWLHRIRYILQCSENNSWIEIDWFDVVIIGLLILWAKNKSPVVISRGIIYFEDLFTLRLQGISTPKDIKMYLLDKKAYLRQRFFQQQQLFSAV